MSDLPGMAPEAPSAATNDAEGTAYLRRVAVSLQVGTADGQLFLSLGDDDDEIWALMDNVEAAQLIAALTAELRKQLS